MRRVKDLIATGASGFLLLASAAPVFAQQVPIAPPRGSIGNVPIENIPQFVINLVFLVGIVVAIVFLIYGGIKWILSGGDKSAVESARNHIIASIIGLVIVAGAFFILQIVFRLLGVANPLEQGFRLPSLVTP